MADKFRIPRFDYAWKRPCLYPLPDGRRCCECETCQEQGAPR